VQTGQLNNGNLVLFSFIIAVTLSSQYPHHSYTPASVLQRKTRCGDAVTLTEILICSRRLRSLMKQEHVFNRGKDTFRKNLVKYTGKAFEMLPRLDNPRILDIGCGSGVPTMELAHLCNGQILAVDIDQQLLNSLEEKISEAGLSDRVHTLNCSLFQLDFPDEDFDLIWSEGSISTIGFARGLQEWRRILRPGGFMVVHDEEKGLSEKCEQISHSGYHLIGSFVLSGDTWWREYYVPLEKYITEIRRDYSDNPEVISFCDTEQREIDMVKANPGQYGSVFFIMQKTEKENFFQ
jgi:ubiquinone/menaquinone biosynthesis C-methylase UbiE